MLQAPMEGKMGMLLLATAFLSAAFLQTAGAGASLPAIYVFGDSSVDVGNNNYLPGNEGKGNFPPYGIDYPHRKPTGRFNNGYTPADFLAKRLGFKESPPAYLSITKDAQIIKGVNFASGGSGILDTTAQNFSIPLNAQIKYFESITRRLKARMGDAAADAILSESLFFFSTGTNDLFDFYSTFGLQNRTQGDQFIRSLAYQFKNQLQVLYKLGARKFAVFSTTLTGCVPFLRRTTASGDCVEVLNEFSLQFNKATKPLLHDLASSSRGMSYSYVDIYEVFSDVLSKPLKYGFKEVRSACCGAGRFNVDSGCTRNATYCSDRGDHFFWDRSHPSQAANKLMADSGFDGGPKVVIPVNIEKLARS